MDDILENSHHIEMNKTREEGKNNEYISIDDINYKTRKVRITSPRSIKAMKKLGIKNEDLEYLTSQEYINKNPELRGEAKVIQSFIYKCSQKIRIGLINRVREARNKIIEEGQYKSKRSTSSKYRKTMGLDGIINNVYKFSEKDLKTFKRMQNINKTNLFNRLEIELNKELRGLINNEQRQKENKKKLIFEQKLERRLKLQNKKKMFKEEEKIRLEKETDKIKRKEEVNRIEQLKKEEDEEEKLKMAYQMKELEYQENGRLKNESFQKKLKELREMKHRSIVEKNEQKQLKIIKNLIKLNKERKRKRLNSEINFKKRMQIVEENKKKLEENIELNNQLLLYKQQSQQRKRAKEEERRNKEMKLYQQKVIAQISKGNSEDLQMMVKQKNLNEAQIIQFLNNTPFLNEKEKKQKETLIKNEILMNKRKENIMNKIHEKERNFDYTQYEKDYKNFLLKKEKIKKNLDQENRVKLIGQYLENKRENLREELKEKDKRVQNFNRNKTDLIHQKRKKYDEIMKEKDLDNEQFEKIMNKKSFDKKSLQSFKEMFPENDKIDKIINELNIHLGKKDNYRYPYDYQY